MGGLKMAKSAGNFIRITELAADGVDPLAFRYLTLGTRYGRKLNLTDASIRAAAAGLESLRRGLRRLGPPPSDGAFAAPGLIDGSPIDGSLIGGTQLGDRAHEPSAPLSTAGRELHDRFVAALDDDLDLPVALAVVRAMLRAPLDQDERRWLVLDADAVLGLGLDRAWEVDAAPTGRDVDALLADRTAARAAHDFVRADALRSQIEALGWDVVDGPDGTTVRSRSEVRSRSDRGG
jgi:cysteinyl-tRNA synthetase